MQCIGGVVGVWRGTWSLSRSSFGNFWVFRYILDWGQKGRSEGVGSIDDFWDLGHEQKEGNPKELEEVSLDKISNDLNLKNLPCIENDICRLIISLHVHSKRGGRCLEIILCLSKSVRFLIHQSCHWIYIYYFGVDSLKSPCRLI